MEGYYASGCQNARRTRLFGTEHADHAGTASGARRERQDPAQNSESFVRNEPMLALRWYNRRSDIHRPS